MRKETLTPAPSRKREEGDERRALTAMWSRKALKKLDTAPAGFIYNSEYI